MKERCDLCKWFEPNAMLPHYGECRRHSPTPIPTPRTISTTRQGSTITDWSAEARWPEVRVSDGCGDWEAKR